MATETTSEVHHEGGHEAFPPFDAQHYPSQIFWFVVAFAILYVLMSRIALPRVGEIKKKRSDTIANELDQAQKLQAQADAAGAAYEKTLADAKARAQSVAQDMHAKLAAETASKRHELEADLNQRLAAAEAQIKDTKEKAMSNVGTIARDAAAAIVQHLTGRPADVNAIARAQSEGGGRS
ncbi:MAG: F0F1 ATP synthase subunit B' [Methylobacteriaceae bacterium]|nr:F0F1 ATP synthase subunit B' [Methylobacteriaceae bacterium]